MHVFTENKAEGRVHRCWLEMGIFVCIRCGTRKYPPKVKGTQMAWQLQRSGWYEDMDVPILEAHLIKLFQLFCEI